MFLSETKNRRLLLQNIQADLGLDHLFTFEPLGCSRGLALFFMNEFQVNVLFSNNRMIDIEAVIDGIKVYMTFVLWGSCTRETRSSLGTSYAFLNNEIWTLVYDRKF